MDGVADGEVAPVDRVQADVFRSVAIRPETYTETASLKVSNQLVQILVDEAVRVLSRDIELLDPSLSAFLQESLEVQPLLEVCLALVKGTQLVPDIFPESEVALDVALPQEVDIREAGSFPVPLLVRVYEETLFHIYL